MTKITVEIKDGIDSSFVQNSAALKEFFLFNKHVYLLVFLMQSIILNIQYPIGTLLCF